MGKATAAAVLAHAGVHDGEVHVIEPANIGSGLFGWGDPAVVAARDGAARARQDGR